MITEENYIINFHIEPRILAELSKHHVVIVLEGIVISPEDVYLGELQPI